MQKIIKNKSLYKRTMKIIKMLELHLNYENFENLRIPQENNEKHENFRIPFQNNENYENHRISQDNQQK